MLKGNNSNQNCPKSPDKLQTAWLLVGLASGGRMVYSLS